MSKGVRVQSEDVGALPDGCDGYLEFSTSMRVDDESGLLAAVGTVRWRYYDGAFLDDVDDVGDVCRWVDGEELARAEVWGYDGMMSSWDDTDAALRNFSLACDVVSEDLYVASERLRLAYANGELAEVERMCLTHRWLVLDHVFVAEDVRGFGLGRAVAAHALEMAGAWSDGVAIVSVAGARVDRSGLRAVSTGGGDDGYAEVWEVQRRRSARLLGSLGLVCLPSGIHFGHTSLAGSFPDFARRCSLSGDGLPWVVERT